MVTVPSVHHLSPKIRRSGVSQAILLGDPEIVEALLTAGADPRIETPRGYPLTIAASLVRFHNTTTTLNTACPLPCCFMDL